MILLVCESKNDTNELIYKTKIDSQTSNIIRYRNFYYLFLMSYS